MSPADASGDATRLMNAAAAGDASAGDHLVPIVYEQLRRAARKQLASERAGHTLSATAGPRDTPGTGRAHFYAAAAGSMRRILVDHARARVAHKRGGPDARKAAVNLAGLPDLESVEESSGFLILEDAISRLERVDPRTAQVVRLRYFAGLSIEETAAALGVSPPTVKRTWAFARGWLREAMTSERD